MLLRLRNIVTAVALAGVLACAAHADDASAGREIASKWGNCVVKVQLVLKMGMSYGGRDGGKEEAKLEVTGTVVDSSGLIVTSLAMSNPADLVGNMYAGEEGMQMSSEVTDVKIRTADGKEIPGKIVLRDKDLDLAFIRPAKKLDQPMVCVNMAEKASAQMLDQVLVLNRLGKSANRSLSGTLDRIRAIVEKPRKFYVPNALSDESGLGSPVFNMEGKLLGVMLLRTSPRQSGDSFMSSDSVMGVIVPAEDIAEVADQAPEDAPKGTTPEAVKKPTPAPVKSTPAPKKPAATPKKK